MYLDAGSHELAVEAGVYLVRAREGVAADVDAGVFVHGVRDGIDADVVTIVDGKPSRRTPRRLFRVMPSIKRKELARFLRRSPPEASPPRVSGPGRVRSSLPPRPTG